MRTRPLFVNPPWTAGDDELLRSLLAVGGQHRHYRVPVVT